MSSPADAYFLIPHPPGLGYRDPSGTPRSAVARNPLGSPGHDFRVAPPVRLFDTRGTEPHGLVQVPKARIAAGGELRVHVAAVGGVPNHGARAVSLNVTATNTAGDGYLTVHPCGARPLTSNVNYLAGQTVANAVIAPISASGDVCFYSSADTDVTADVNGWFAGGDGFQAITPTRVFDSRPGEPDGAVHIAKQRYGPGQLLTLRLTDVAGVPADATAASLNVTATQPAAPGYVTVYPCGERPLASSLNFRAGQTVPNAVIAPLAADGLLCFYASVDTHLIADINGYMRPVSSFHPVVPTRLIDTRPTEPDGAAAVPKQTVGANRVLRVNVAGLAGTPPTGVSAVSLNVTATNTAGAGFVTVYPAEGGLFVSDPCGRRPLASNVNYSAASTVPNAVLASLGSGGLCIYSYAETDLVVDINGWFAT
jgi:hypothetical protein